MLGFFQKYQKAFFLFVTFLIVASFALSGVFDTFVGDQRTQANHKIGENIDGSPMMFSTVHNLSRFIATDREDFALPNAIPNLCNDGVIRHDLLGNGIADLLVSDYFETLKEDLTFRLERAKSYRGYENPEAPFISVRSVWDRFMPALLKEWDALKREEEATASTFSHLSSLYQQQSVCPPEFVRRVLHYSETRASWIKPDPYLQYADLALFGFHTVSDWFGKNFVDLSAQFILNAAKLAEQKGYKVSLEEAKADLLRNFQASIEKLSDKKRTSTLTLGEHLRSLGMNEKSAAESWRAVLLFRRYFQEVGGSTFVDQLPYRDFAAFSRESFVIQKYEWPESLQLKTAQDLIDFQVYLAAIGGQLNTLSLPSHVLPIETIAAATPELYQATYRMNVASVTLEEVGLRASFKQVLDWQLDATNWDLLTFTFPFLEKAMTHEDRFVCLENLSSGVRSQIDQFARKEWAKKKPEVIVQLLQERKGTEKTVSIAQNWISLPEIENPRELCALIESAANGDCIVKELLERYSDQGHTFYRFEQIEKVAEPHVLTFQEAKELGVMSRISDRFLSEEYKKIRSKHSSQFQNKEGEWKLFSTVKEDVATIVFADLFKRMGKEKETLAYYASHRLEKVANEALLAFKKNKEDATWLEKDGHDPILNQFKLVRNECLIKRSTKDEWMKSQVFMMLPNDWSPVYVPPDGNVSFFYFERKQPNNEPILEQISLGKEVIAADAQRYVAKALLSKARMKKSIVIPMISSEL